MGEKFWYKRKYLDYGQNIVYYNVFLLRLQSFFESNPYSIKLWCIGSVWIVGCRADFEGNQHIDLLEVSVPCFSIIDELGTRTHKRSWKNGFKIVSTCMVDGTKPSFRIIFKHKKFLKGNFPPKVIFLKFPDFCNVWMSESEILYWIENKHARLSDPQSLLYIVWFCKRRFGIKYCYSWRINISFTTSERLIRKSFKAKINLLMNYYYYYYF